MIFTLRNTINGARLGLIDGVERLPEFSWETPNLLIYMKGGITPHITPDIFREVTKGKNGILYFPASSIIHFHEAMKKYQGNIGQFIAMQNHLSFVSLIDSGIKRVSGYNTEGHIPMWTMAGKKNINPETYMDFIEAIEPDLFSPLCDNDTDIDSKNKRVQKSLVRTMNFFEKCMGIYNNSSKLKKCKVISSLVGGYHEEVRERCSENVASTPVFGVSIEGLHDCGDQVPFLEAKDMELMIKASLKHTSEDKLRICHGSWNPKTVLDLISLGIDILDTSFPCIVAEDGGALTFENDERTFEDDKFQMTCNDEKVDEIENDSLNCESPCSDEPLKKKSKYNTKNKQFYISLQDKKYAECFEPIINECMCLTCKNHTKAYIHHLLNVKELLGTTLLAIHNLHHYIRFFESIRMALKAGKFENMKSNFSASFKS